MRAWLVALVVSIGAGVFALTACVGDGPVGNDAGGDVATSADGGGDAGPSCAYAASVREDHPLYYYRFAVANPPNEGTADGGLTNDAAMITVDPPGAVACESTDESVHFDGTGAIQVLGQLDAPKTTSFSIELLFEPEAGSAAYARLFSRESFPEAPSTKNLEGYALIYDESAGPHTVIFSRYAYVSKDAGSDDDAVFATLEDKTGFRHVAATFDGTNIKVYIDGTVRGTVPSNVQPNATPTARAFIGGRVTPAGSFDAKLKGRIDEVAYYNYALTPERVAIHYAGLQ